MSDYHLNENEREILAEFAESCAQKGLSGQAALIRRLLAENDDLRKRRQKGADRRE